MRKKIFFWIIPAIVALFIGTMVVSQTTYDRTRFLRVLFDLDVNRDANIDRNLTADSTRSKTANIDTITNKRVNMTGDLIGADSIRAHDANIDTVTSMRINTSGQIAGSALVITMDSIRGGSANIDTITNKRINMTGDLIGADSIRAHDANIDTITSIRINASGQIAGSALMITMDSIRGGSANIDTTTGMRVNVTGLVGSITATGNFDTVRSGTASVDTVWGKRSEVTGTAKAAYVEATANVTATGNIISQDSVRGPSLDGDTLWNIKAIIIPNNNDLIAGKFGLVATVVDSYGVYIPGIKPRDVIVGSLQPTIWGALDSVFSVRLMAGTDSIHVQSFGRAPTTSDTINYIRIAIK